MFIVLTVLVFLLQGAIELNNSFYIAGDNFALAAKRTMNNICNIQDRRAHEGR